MTWRSKAILTACLAAFMAAGPALAVDDLGQNGRYDAITIHGLTFGLADLARLQAAGVLTFDPARGKFAFGPAITSERALQAALPTLTNPQAPMDLYRATKVALPGPAAQTLTVPSGYGPARLGNQPGRLSLSASIGGVGRVPYTNSPDGGLGFALSGGNAFDGVGAAVMMSFNDLSDLGNPDRISWGISLSHYINDGLSVALTGENLFVKTTDGEASFALTGSWAFTPATSAMPFAGVATLGVGSGRFAHMTERDRAEGKAAHATGVFGSLSYAATPKMNLIAEWNGRNLNAGMALSLKRGGIGLKLGVQNLTGHSGDGPIVMGSIAVPLARF